MRAELFIEEPSELPAFVASWPLERKADEIINWIEANFVDEAEFSIDFSEWDNEDELEDEIRFSEFSTDAILRKYWGHLLTLNDFEALSQKINEDVATDWLPSEERLHLDESDDEQDEEDDDKFDSIQDIISEIPRITNALEVLVSSLPHGIGHNGGPSDLGDAVASVNQLRNDLATLQSMRDPSPDAQSSRGLLQRIASGSLSIAKFFLAHARQKGDLFLSEFAKSSGSTIGKLAPWGLASVLASSSLQEFARKIMEFLAQH